MMALSTLGHVHLCFSVVATRLKDAHDSLQPEASELYTYPPNRK